MCGAAALILLSTVVTNAQETGHTVTWKNIVSADDTAVFWVLAVFAVLLLVLIWVVAGVTNALLSDKELWKEKWANSPKVVVAMLFGGAALLGPAKVMAQVAETTAGPFQMTDGLFWTMVVLDVFLLLVLFALLYNLNGLIRTLRRTEEPEEVEKDLASSFWEGSLSAAVPVEQEAEIMMDHEYDGIRELDNKLPPWWLYMFYFTIVFGVVYIGYYHFFGGPTQLDEYDREMALAEEQKAAFLASSANNVDENTVTLLTDAESLSSGKQTFETLCAACHGKTGGSTQVPPGVGPNLTDDYWLHGGGIKNIFKTIKYGVPAKGMISWEAQLSPRQIQEVASYIVSLHGTEPENAKEPQGELWTEDGAAAAPADPAAADVSGEVTANATE